MAYIGVHRVQFRKSCLKHKIVSFGRCGTDAVLEEDYQQRIQQLEEVRFASTLTFITNTFSHVLWLAFIINLHC